MNIEELNKSQIILLTLLTSFVTSIATGIVTVSLMDQAPPGMTHTISKVVERTIETVVPEKTQAGVVVKTIIVEQKDALADAVAKNAESLVRIKKVSEDEETFISMGFIVSDDGMVVTDSANVGSDIEYIVELSDGNEIAMSVIDQSEGTGIAILSADEIDESIIFVPVVFADDSALSLGESVVALTGKENSKIRAGVITSLNMSEREVIGEEGAEPTIQKYLYAIYTNAILKKSDSGSMLFDLKGEVAGMNLVRDGNVFTLPADAILQFISNLTPQENTVDETTN
ncbi:trypsin-like peptidase domain-containing protein [Patescibacteria group bacterium]